MSALRLTPWPLALRGWGLLAAGAALLGVAVVAALGGSWPGAAILAVAASGCLAAGADDLDGWRR